MLFGRSDRGGTLPVSFADISSSALLVGARRRRRAAQTAAKAAARGDPGAVRVLAEAMESADATVRTIARQSLTGLTDPAAIEVLCTFMLDHDARDVRAIVAERSVYPQDPKTRALFFIMLERWEEYYTLDPGDGHPLLAAAYAGATPLQRKRIRDVLRRSGKSHILGEAVLPLMKRGKTDRKGPAEWREIADILTEGERYDDLWRLVVLVPPAQAAEIVGFLEKTGWKPHGSDQTLWEELRTNLQSAHIVGSPVMIHDFGAGAGGIGCMIFSLGGDRFFGGSSDGTITAWNVQDGSIVHAVRAHTGAVSHLAFAGDYLVSGGNDGIRVWDPGTMDPIRSTRVTGKVTTLRGLAETGACVGGTEAGGLHVLEPAGQGAPRRLEGTGGMVTCAVVFPGGERIAGGDTRGGV
ncbi:MAG: hypothetical protein LUQ13_04510, partial [Methanomicrobiales archaeon]|nr:hypothetical protein [Methanomicrobiales archaeon]